MYQLKKGQESFDMVDGEFAGRKYRKGKVYDAVPPNEKHKFEAVQGSKVQRSKVEKTVNREPGTVNREPGTVNREPGTATERSKS